MSNAVETTCWKVKVGNKGAKMVLISLADNASDEGYCWPSLNLIADKTEHEVRSVQRALRFLEEKGLIEVVHEAGKGNYYWVIPGAINSNKHPISVKKKIQAFNEKLSIANQKEQASKTSYKKKLYTPPSQCHGSDNQNAVLSALDCHELEQAITTNNLTYLGQESRSKCA